jgi:hypothetical protein
MQTDANTMYVNNQGRYVWKWEPLPDGWFDFSGLDTANYGLTQQSPQDRDRDFETRAAARAAGLEAHPKDC